MTQQLSMLVFVEDTGLIPRTRMWLTAFHNSSSRALMPHSDLDTDLRHVVQRHNVQTEHSYT